MSSSSAWTREETLKLIEFWGDSEIQSCKRNQGVFEKIAKELQEVGFGRTYQQCRKKIKKLRMEYRKVKDGRNKTGEDRKEWEFFDGLDDILGTKPSTQPPIVIDTSEATGEMECSPSTPASKETTPEIAGPSGSTKSSATGPGDDSQGKKRKRSKADDMDGVVQQLLCAMEKSDKRLLKLKKKDEDGGMSDGERVPDEEGRAKISTETFSDDASSTLHDRTYTTTTSSTSGFSQRQSFA